MKKIIISVVSTALVIALIATGILLFTATDSKQLNSENLNTYYDVKVEITDYVQGEKASELLGILATYEPSTAKIHITVTPKDDITCDGGELLYTFRDNLWKVTDGDQNIKVTLNPEGVTEVYIDIESDLKLSQVNAPDLNEIEFNTVYGTVTYKKFFNKL
ncbi:MAG: hypothetical protein J6V78_01470 [Clostridia bacterium]|nr:hypothetical protein [Clostridia bacterium]